MPARPRSQGNAHYSTNNSDCPVAGSSARLAIQRWLGLLSKRRDRIDSIDSDNPRRDGAGVKSETEQLVAATGLRR